MYVLEVVFRIYPQTELNISLPNSGACFFLAFRGWNLKIIVEKSMMRSYEN